MKNWSDKIVLVTGASSGLGEGLALALAKRGAVLGLIARRRDLLSQVAEKCTQAGGKARIFPVDITSESEVAEAADALRNEFGRIDVLIANAGIGGNDEETRSYMPRAVRKLIDTNLMGAVNSVHAVLPQMIARHSGQLVAISSLAGYRGLPRSGAYSASKAAMSAFFESVRLDTKYKGIKVTIIHPGFIKTPLTAGRHNKMPFLMELEDGVAAILDAIEKEKAYAAFPWQLAMIVRAGKIMPAWLYDKIAGRARYRE